MLGCQGHPQSALNADMQKDYGCAPGGGRPQGHVQVHAGLHVLEGVAGHAAHPGTTGQPAAPRQPGGLASKDDEGVDVLRRPLLLRPQ